MLWICDDCGTAYAVGLHRCPNCGGEEFHESTRLDWIKEQSMPKITALGGPSDIRGEVAPKVGVGVDEGSAPGTSRAQGPHGPGGAPPPQGESGAQGQAPEGSPATTPGGEAGTAQGAGPHDTVSAREDGEAPRPSRPASDEAAPGPSEDPAAVGGPAPSSDTATAAPASDGAGAAGSGTASAPGPAREGTQGAGTEPATARPEGDPAPAHGTGASAAGTGTQAAPGEDGETAGGPQGPPASAGSETRGARPAGSEGVAPGVAEAGADAAHGAPEDVPGPEALSRPAVNEPKARWVAYVAALTERQLVEVDDEYTKADLVRLYGRST